MICILNTLSCKSIKTDTKYSNDQNQDERIKNNRFEFEKKEYDIKHKHKYVNETSQDIEIESKLQDFLEGKTEEEPVGAIFLKIDQKIDLITKFKGKIKNEKEAYDLLLRNIDEIHLILLIQDGHIQLVKSFINSNSEHLYDRSRKIKNDVFVIFRILFNSDLKVNPIFEQNLVKNISKFKINKFKINKFKEDFYSNYEEKLTKLVFDIIGCSMLFENDKKPCYFQCVRLLTDEIKNTNLKNQDIMNKIKPYIIDKKKQKILVSRYIRIKSPLFITDDIVNLISIFCFVKADFFNLLNKKEQSANIPITSFGGYENSNKDLINCPSSIYNHNGIRYPSNCNEINLSVSLFTQSKDIGNYLKNDDRASSFTFGMTRSNNLIISNSDDSDNDCNNLDPDDSDNDSNNLDPDDSNNFDPYRFDNDSDFDLINYRHQRALSEPPPMRSRSKSYRSLSDCVDILRSPYDCFKNEIV